MSKSAAMLSDAIELEDCLEKETLEDYRTLNEKCDTIIVKIKNRKNKEKKEKENQQLKKG